MAGTATVTDEIRTQIVSLVRDFVRRDVAPVAAQYDHDDIYPAELVDTMREMGLFGITIPEEYGGLGLDHATLAIIFEELSRGWMSVSGVIGTHHLMAAIIADHGTAGAEGAPAAAHGPGRGPGRAGADRAGGGQRRAEHQHDGGARRRRVRPERQQDVHHERRERKRLRGPCQDRHRRPTRRTGA